MKSIVIFLKGSKSIDFNCKIIKRTFILLNVFWEIIEGIKLPRNCQFYLVELELSRLLLPLSFAALIHCKTYKAGLMRHAIIAP